MTVLLVVITIVLFISVDYLVERRRGHIAAAQPIIPQRLPLRTPAGIFFSKSHTWLNLFPSGKIRLGLDDFVLRLLESPSLTLLKKTGDPVTKGETIATISDGQRSVSIKSPIDGTIDLVNNALSRNLAVTKENLFNNGWAYSISPKRVSDLSTMMLGEATQEWLQKELRRFREFIASSTGALTPNYALAQDGGVPVEGALKNLNHDQIKRFEEEFLIA